MTFPGFGSYAKQSFYRIEYASEEYQIYVVVTKMFRFVIIRNKMPIQ